MTLTPAARSRQNVRRLRAQLWPILETAGAAPGAWDLAELLLGGRETGFAPIAAVICLGATIGQQRERALELTGGVVLGVLIADLLVRVLGSGPPQVGVMMGLAMSAAGLGGGGPVLRGEGGGSAGRGDDGVGHVGGGAGRRWPDADGRGERLGHHHRLQRTRQRWSVPDPADRGAGGRRRRLRRARAGVPARSRPARRSRRQP